MLRSWHEKGKNNETWQKLRLVLSHSQEVYISLDVNKGNKVIPLCNLYRLYFGDRLQD
ncbi:AAA-like domain-containing protein [Dolichospermum sp. LEGE 00240]|jgi:hypothetical protein|uniref:AAA-like domain-containing protein n=1 Tax=Dolichospermum sp. LEGE 00240 TaxID=1828603 RepID=UPI00351C7ED5|nr:AAA-like domain-containing protein [Aphanizomenon gracile PMC638.10]